MMHAALGVQALYSHKPPGVCWTLSPQASVTHGNCRSAISSLYLLSL